MARNELVEGFCGGAVQILAGQGGQGVYDVQAADLDFGFYHPAGDGFAVDCGYDLWQRGGGGRSGVRKGSDTV